MQSATGGDCTCSFAGLKTYLICPPLTRLNSASLRKSSKLRLPRAIWLSVVLCC